MAIENDIVLIYFEDQPFSFARVEEILPDSKKDWYHVKLLLLQIPLQTVTWILKNAYINGDEFTMSGKRMRLEQVISPDDPKPGEVTPREKDQKNPDNQPGKANVVSLSDRIQKNDD